MCPHVHACACSVSEVADAVVESLAAMGYTRAAFVGHSYGSLVTGRILKARPHVVSADGWRVATPHPSWHPMVVHPHPGSAGIPARLGGQVARADAVGDLDWPGRAWTSDSDG